MTNPAPEVPSTAVVKAGPKFPEPIQNAIDLARMKRAVAKEVAKLSWGAAMTREACEAIAEWGQQHAVDVTTEIYILGNRIYLNADFYKRKLGEMIAADLVDWFRSEFVHHDVRLEKLTAEEDAEAKVVMNRRQSLRIKYNVPENAKSACVFSLKLKSLEEPIIGVKWCGDGRKDPVGDQFPTETSETRAIRRALKLAVSHVPAIANRVGPAELAAKALESTISSAHATVKEEVKELRRINAPTPVRGTLTADEYCASGPVKPTPAQLDIEMDGLGLGDGAPEPE